MEPTTATTYPNAKAYKLPCGLTLRLNGVTAVTQVYYVAYKLHGAIQSLITGGYTEWNNAYDEATARNQEHGGDNYVVVMQRITVEEVV